MSREKEYYESYSCRFVPQYPFPQQPEDIPITGGFLKRIEITFLSNTIGIISEAVELSLPPTSIYGMPGLPFVIARDAGAMNPTTIFLQVGMPVSKGSLAMARVVGTQFPRMYVALVYEKERLKP